MGRMHSSQGHTPEPPLLLFFEKVSYAALTPCSVANRIVEVAGGGLPCRAHGSKKENSWAPSQCLPASSALSWAVSPTSTGKQQPGKSTAFFYIHSPVNSIR